MTTTGAPAVERGIHGCNRCPKRWSGTNIAHCSACHETFGGVGSFDRHRAGTKDGRFKREECTAPADLGLTLNEHGTWTVPSNGVDFKEVFA